VFLLDKHNVLEQLPKGADWFTFTCSSCGCTVSISRPPGFTLAEFAARCHYLFDEPEICTDCQTEARY
jgi:hypothetical protein